MSSLVLDTRELPSRSSVSGAYSWWQQEQPFTFQQAVELGGTRHQLEVLLRGGQLRRLLRGVYVWEQVPLSAEVRALALQLLLKPQRYVYEATAAWLHGLPSLLEAPIPLRSRQLPRQQSGSSSPGNPKAAEGRLDTVAGVSAVAPMVAVLQLALQRAPTDYASAVSVLDEALAHLEITHAALIDYVQTATHQMPASQAQLARGLVALADSRAMTAAETRLRLAWHRGHLPTPIPGYRCGPKRLSLALPQHRFGFLVHRSSESQPDLPIPWWHIVSISETELHSSSLALITQRLEYEFHQHLLDQVG